MLNAFSTPSHPTSFHIAASLTKSDDKATMVVTSNTSNNAGSVPQHTLGMLVEPSLAVAHTGVTSFFLTKGAPCQNKRLTVNPVSMTLPDGQKRRSTHVCNIIIPGLPIVLTGHIMPDMPTTSLFGIRNLCKAGCKVLFDDDKCLVILS